MKNREISKLEQIRKEKGLTREQCSMLCGVAPITIQKLEIGELTYNTMKLDTLIKLCKGLRVKPSEILPIELARKIK